MKKTFILTLVLALGALTTKANDFNLYYVANDGALVAQKWEVNKLQKITFEEGKMNVIETDGSTTVVSLSDIQKLVFYTEEGATDIKDVRDETPEQTKEDVYDLMGRKLNIDRDQLPSGIYIIAGKKTFIK